MSFAPTCRCEPDASGVIRAHQPHCPFRNGAAAAGSARAPSVTRPPRHPHQQPRPNAASTPAVATSNDGVHDLFDTRDLVTVIGSYLPQNEHVKLNHTFFPPSKWQTLKNMTGLVSPLSQSDRQVRKQDFLNGAQPHRDSYIPFKIVDRSLFPKPETTGRHIEKVLSAGTETTLYYVINSSLFTVNLKTKIVSGPFQAPSPLIRGIAPLPNQNKVVIGTTKNQLISFHSTTGAQQKILFVDRREITDVIVMGKNDEFLVVAYEDVIKIVDSHTTKLLRQFEPHRGMRVNKLVAHSPELLGCYNFLDENYFILNITTGEKSPPSKGKHETNLPIPCFFPYWYRNRKIVMIRQGTKNMLAHLVSIEEEYIIIIYDYLTLEEPFLFQQINDFEDIITLTALPNDNLAVVGKLKGSAVYELVIYAADNPNAASSSACSSPSSASCSSSSSTLGTSSSSSSSSSLCTASSSSSSSSSSCSAEPVGVATAPAPRVNWLCNNCYVRNPSDATACTHCGRPPR